MASQKEFHIHGGPSRFHLQAAVFDIENPRLLEFKFRKGIKPSEEEGSTKVWISGVEQGSIPVEEWHLSGWFMPQGLDTLNRDMVRFTGHYSSRSRLGVLYTDGQTISGKVDTETLVKWAKVSVQSVTHSDERQVKHFHELKIGDLFVCQGDNVRLIVVEGANGPKFAVPIEGPDKSTQLYLSEYAKVIKLN